MVAKSSAHKYLLIIANSGRLLTQSVNSAGYLPLVIDCFGDSDTEQLAHDNWVVEQLSINSLQLVIDQIIHLYSVEYVIVGSGFESQHNSLAWLQTKFKLLGNTSDIVKSINDPKEFSRTLQALQINQPETRFQPPRQDFDQWLIKPYASEGGIGIKRFQGQAGQQEVYWQRFQSGPVYSALFVAIAYKARLIGINRQWQTEQCQGQDFVFSGLIQVQDLPQYSATIVDWIAKLTVAYGLTGLNGIDFIVHDNQCWLLEINPRPPASIALYDQAMVLIKLHIDACNGRLPEHINTQTAQISAYQIMFAQAPLTIPIAIDWPGWISDRPGADTKIGAEQPICSIIATAENTDAVMRLLQHRMGTIHQLLKY